MTLPRGDDPPAVLDLVYMNPGCNLQQLQRRTGLPRRRFDSALQYLVEARCVAIHIEGPRKHALPFKPGILDHAAQIVALRLEGVPEIHAWHRRQGPCTRANLLARAREHVNWGEHLANKRIRQMLNAALIRRVSAPVADDQRRTWFEALDVVQSTDSALPAGARTSPP